jgi:hypothetical protein
MSERKCKAPGCDRPAWEDEEMASDLCSECMRSRSQHNDVCPWCGKLIRREGALCLHTLSVKRQLARHGKDAWLEREYHFSHYKCNPVVDGEKHDELGYHIELKRIRALGVGGLHSTKNDTYWGWVRHLAEKEWFSPQMLEGLAWAHLYASKGSLHGMGANVAFVRDLVEDAGVWIMGQRPTWPEYEREIEQPPTREFRVLTLSQLLGESSMRPYVKLHQDGKQVAISTNAETEPDFIRGAAEALCSLQSAMTTEEMAAWLPQVVDVCCTIRGYKAPLVQESRVLVAGRIAPNDASVVASSATPAEAVDNAIQVPA